MKPHNIGTRRELFVDDFLIETRRDVRFALQHPERREAFTFDAPWEGHDALSVSVVMDQGVVRLYYRAGVADLHDEERTGMVAVLESRDGGLSFTRSNLGLHEFKGAKANNILDHARILGLGGVRVRGMR